MILMSFWKMFPYAKHIHKAPWAGYGGCGGGIEKEAKRKRKGKRKGKIKGKRKGKRKREKERTHKWKIKVKERETKPNQAINTPRFVRRSQQKWSKNESAETENILHSTDLLMSERHQTSAQRCANHQNKEDAITHGRDRCGPPPLKRAWWLDREFTI